MDTLTCRSSHSVKITTSINFVQVFTDMNEGNVPLTTVDHTVGVFIRDMLVSIIYIMEAFLKEFRMFDTYKAKANYMCFYYVSTWFK